MRKNLGLLAATVAVLGGLTFGNIASAADFSVAVVDVPQVVSASKQVQNLKKEQQLKAEEIIKFIEKARKDVADITDANKKKAAEEKYTKELQQKREKIEVDYANKLKQIDTSISQQIEAQAKAKGFDMVLSKGIVLFGGTDITADVIKVVK
jgi:outer membrane protein